MANQDHVFVKIEVVDRKADSLAVVRVDRKGKPVCSFSDCVSVGEDFGQLISRMKREILDERYSSEYVVVAHYPEIERGYLSREYKSKKTDEVFNGRMWLSVSQLVWPMVDAQMVPSVSFDVVCTYFGIDRTIGAGLNAEKDCTALVRVFFELMSRYRSALIVDETVRDFGGTTLESIRKVIGF
jgi:DNA polymerase III epsilon subunit-like protein